MKLDEVYEILNKIHDNQDVVSFESLIKLITNCKEIKIVRPRIVYGEDIFEQYVYKIEIKIDNIDCNLWLYFYDENTVTIQQIFSYNRRVKSINYSNKERMKLEFEPIRISRETIDKVDRTLSKYC